MVLRTKSNLKEEIGLQFVHDDRFVAAHTCVYLILISRFHLTSLKKCKYSYNIDFSFNQAFTKMISNSSLQKFDFQDPYVSIIIIYRKCTMVWTRLLWRRKKYMKKNKSKKTISRVIIGTAK